MAYLTHFPLVKDGYYIQYRFQSSCIYCKDGIFVVVGGAGEGINILKCKACGKTIRSKSIIIKNEE